MKFKKDPTTGVKSTSHPSRGAWIEIVGRLRGDDGDASHPSRGAWIEIYEDGKKNARCAVAPLTGCVD